MAALSLSLSECIGMDSNHIVVSGVCLSECMGMDMKGSGLDVLGDLLWRLRQ